MAVRRKDGGWSVAKLQSGDWHPEEIKASVRMALPRMSLSKLGHQQGIHPQACIHAIHRPHFEGEMAIANLLGVIPAEIWPSRHDAFGTRICQIKTRRNPTDAAERRHPENQVVA